jgi:hypothetical protein
MPKHDHYLAAERSEALVSVAASAELVEPYLFTSIFSTHWIKHSHQVNASARTLAHRSLLNQPEDPNTATLWSITHSPMPK